MRFGSKMKIVGIILLVIMALGHLNVQAQNRRREMEVRKAVERFYLHFSRREYGRMWDQLSDATKDGNDYNKARYIGELRRTDSFRLSIEIKNVKIIGDQSVIESCVTSARSRLLGNHRLS